MVVGGWSVDEVVRERGSYRGGWRLQLRHGDGRREGKLGLEFWLCEGEKVLRCYFMIGYFCEWRIDDVASFKWLF